jgi:hypothetical protein
MKFKTLASTVAALAVLSVVAWFLQRPPAPPTADPRIGQPLFDPRELDQTARIRLTDQGKTVLLARQSDGKWLDSSYYDLPVDFGKLSRFTDDLASAKVQRLVTRNPEVLARLNFKDTTIALLDAAGKNLWTVTLGKDADSGGRFVKFDHEAKGYLANLTTFLDAEAKNWADSLLIDLKPDDIAAVAVGFDEGEPVVATRAKKEEAWTAGKTPAGQRVDGEKITSLLSSFTSLRFQDTSGCDDPNVEAARQHSRTIKLTTFDHKTITIQLGRKPEERKETGERKPDTGKSSAAASTEPIQNPTSETRNSPASPVKPGEKQENVASTSEAAAANSEPKTQNPEPVAASAAASSQKPEASGQPAAPKPSGEGGKPDVNTQKPEVSSQSSTQNPSAAASNPEPSAAPAVAPAGPVYAFITSSDPAAPVNALMKKRAFQIYDWNFTSLPQKSAELFEPVPAPPPPPKTEAKPAEPKPEIAPAEPAAPESKPATAPAKP